MFYEVVYLFLVKERNIFNFLFCSKFVGKKIQEFRKIEAKFFPTRILTDATINTQVISKTTHLTMSTMMTVINNKAIIAACTEFGARIGAQLELS